MVLVLCQWLSCKKIRLACRNAGVRITNFTVFFSLPLANIRVYWFVLVCTGLHHLSQLHHVVPITLISTPRTITLPSPPPHSSYNHIHFHPHSSHNHTHLHPRSSHNYTHHPLTVHTNTAISTPHSSHVTLISPLTAHIMTLPSPPLTAHTITLISTPSQFTQSLPSPPLTAQSLISTLTAHTITLPSPQLTLSLISTLTAHTITLPSPHSQLTQSHSNLHPLTAPA